METKEKTGIIAEIQEESKTQKPLLVKKRQSTNQQKPKMYLKVRELLANIKSDLAEDIIDNKGE